EYHDAKRILSWLLILDKSDPETNYALARVAFCLGEEEQTERFLRSVATYTGMPPEKGYIMLGVDLRRKGKRTKALRALAAAVKTYPENTALRRLMARMAAESGNDSAAAELYLQCASLDPRFQFSYIISACEHFVRAGLHERTCRVFSSNIDRWALDTAVYFKKAHLDYMQSICGFSIKGLRKSNAAHRDPTGPAASPALASFATNEGPVQAFADSPFPSRHAPVSSPRNMPRNEGLKNIALVSSGLIAVGSLMAGAICNMRLQALKEEPEEVPAERITRLKHARTTLFVLAGGGGFSLSLVALIPMPQFAPR
ncbi:MAG: tetratricopeptide repeat protein, partial [Chitinivibrionales bacterium]|nr:tetratricopeptide repeat protein [Chitinivibrionales bacterium]MBD3357011.1 tetratricopeptide repeat protein [Chitinivibrionales bacterium]